MAREVAAAGVIAGLKQRGEYRSCEFLVAATAKEAGRMDASAVGCLDLAVAFSVPPDNLVKLRLLLAHQCLLFRMAARRFLTDLRP